MLAKLLGFPNVAQKFFLMLNVLFLRLLVSTFSSYARQSALFFDNLSRKVLIQTVICECSEPECS